jgi:hypothetical protein
VYRSAIRFAIGVIERNERAADSLNSIARVSDIGIVARERTQIPSARDWGEK